MIRHETIEFAARMRWQTFARGCGLFKRWAGESLLGLVVLQRHIRNHPKGASCAIEYTGYVSRTGETARVRVT